MFDSVNVWYSRFYWTGDSVIASMKLADDQYLIRGAIFTVYTVGDPKD